MIRALVALVVVAVMGCAIAGIGMGDAPAAGEPAPNVAEVAAARARIAADRVAVGRALFTDEGCDRCHSLAAIGADGKLGPRLDTLDEDLDDNLESIAEPREDTADGYAQHLMPDFGDLLDDADVLALARFVTTASGGEGEGDDEERGRRGRGRGRGGSGEG